MANDGGWRWAHYRHLDPRRGFRWTARESCQFMYNRPWHEVVDFYSDLVSGTRSSLDDLFPTKKRNPQIVDEVVDHCDDNESTHLSNNEKKGRWARTTFKIVLSYNGGHFDGWQKQPGLNTVQWLVEKSLGRYVDEKKALQLTAKSLPVEGCVVVAGRTDKGVTAFRQVCSFYTWRTDVRNEDIKNTINELAPGKLRALHVSVVSRAFHPNFSAKWRRYFYIFPVEGNDHIGDEKNYLVEPDRLNEYQDQLPYCEDGNEDRTFGNGNEDEDASCGETKPRSFNTSKVNQLLCQLEGKTLSYKMFARDTKASRSTGPHTDCFMFHARAAETSLPCADEARKRSTVMCVELVANRFLRKMVRVLVATAIREAAAGSDDDALLKLMDATCRRATAPPAPPDGLCLVEVGYGEFNKEDCLIMGTTTATTTS